MTCHSVQHSSRSYIDSYHGVFLFSFSTNRMKRFQNVFVYDSQYLCHLSRGRRHIADVIYLRNQYLDMAINETYCSLRNHFLLFSCIISCHFLVLFLVIFFICVLALKKKTAARRCYCCHLFYQYQI